jgi:hypothetical protein
MTAARPKYLSDMPISYRAVTAQDKAYRERKKKTHAYDGRKMLVCRSYRRHSLQTSGHQSMETEGNSKVCEPWQSDQKVIEEDRRRNDAQPGLR